MRPGERRGRGEGKGREGAILILVLFIMLVVVTLVLMLGRDARTELAVASSAVDDLKLRVLADSALERALAELRLDTTPGDDLAAAWRDDTARFQGQAVDGGRWWYFVSEQDPGDGREVRYGIEDEASKLDVNLAQRDQLLALPGITEQAVDGIIDFRDEDDEVSGNDGAESSYYASLKPGYVAKNTFFESLDELRRVRGVDDAMLYGEDRNRNGLLDPGEDDGDKSWPPDDADGALDRGLIEYLTVFARDSNLTPEGEQKLVWGSASPQELEERFQQAGMAQPAIQRLLQLKRFNSGAQALGELLTPVEVDEAAAKILLDNVTIQEADIIPGRININTASRPVLEGLPGLEAADVDAILSGRLDRESDLSSPAWLLRALAREKVQACVDLVTTRSDQFLVDIVVLLDGDKGRFKRIQALVDRTQTPVRVLYRRDLTGLGFPFPGERGEGNP